MAEEDPWAFDEGDTAETTTTGGDAAAPAAESGDAAAPSGDAPAEEAAPPPPPEDDGYRKPVQLYRHWVRPKFLQYRYMYNYRTNYYDDVIDYLDKKQKGVSRDVPRAQTWAERVLRTSVGSGRSLDHYGGRHHDTHLIQVLAASIKTHNYHTTAYMNQKYSRVL